MGGHFHLELIPLHRNLCAALTDAGKRHEEYGGRLYRMTAKNRGNLESMMTNLRNDQTRENPMETVSEMDRSKERAGIAFCIVLYCLLRLWRLRETQINGLFDEGVHLALMQMLAAGKGALYGDFLFIHPPGLIWAGTWLWRLVGGDLFSLRVLYILVCSLGFVPMYALARRLYGARIALVTLALLSASPGFANWLGRNIYLELPLNVLLYTALWVIVRPSRLRVATYIGAGAMLGCAYLIKETALPAAVAVCAALWSATRRPKMPGSETSVGHTQPETVVEDGMHPAAWLIVIGAFLIVFGMVISGLNRLPNYRAYTIGLNLHDPYQLATRPYELLNGFYALPFVVTFGLIGVVQMARQRASRPARFLGLFALIMTALMLCLPHRFFWRHLIPALPIYCLGAAVWWQKILSMPSHRVARRTTGVLTLLFGLVHLTVLVLYHTHESPQPPAYNTALTLLRSSPGPLFTLNPIWAAASGQELYPWPFACDAVFARQYDLAPPSRFTEVMLQCPTVLLDKKTLQLLPEKTAHVLRQRYRTIFQYQQSGERHYVEILYRKDQVSLLPDGK